jgi:hypothetical protein
LFQVAFDLGANDNLGLMIRGGIEYGLGIFITGVEPQSAAHRHGLRVSAEQGCQIFLWYNIPKLEKYVK